MRRALPTTFDESRLRALFEELVREARAYRFRVAPNPCVGAAVLAGDEEVGRGFHRHWGGAHAEVEALRAAAQSHVDPARWDTLVVTLEPCSSHGKTPPCTDAILAAGIKRVVVGALDPDPRHAGRGLGLLRDAGLEVELVGWGAPLRDTAPHFLDWTGMERLRRPRPWVIAKWAQTRSGHLVPPREVGDGRWISSPPSLDEVAVMRGRVDALVTGVGTLLADDPRLTVREPGDIERPPLRVVLDSRLRTPPDARILQAPQDPTRERGGDVVILASSGAPPTRFQALIDAGARVELLRPDWHGRLSTDTVSSWLWDQGLKRVLLETGPRLLDTCLKEGVVDQVRIYTGGVFGGRGRQLAHAPGEAGLREILHRESGDDAVLEGFVRP